MQEGGPVLFARIPLLHLHLIEGLGYESMEEVVMVHYLA